jgi:hypothetical protein
MLLVYAIVVIYIYGIKTRWRRMTGLVKSIRVDGKSLGKKPLPLSERRWIGKKFIDDCVVKVIKLSTGGEAIVDELWLF